MFPKRDAVLEIGAEEMPARFMPDALRSLRELGERFLGIERVEYEDVKTYGTPRRLVLYITGVSGRQKELVREARGPARRVAFSEDGRPTRAAEGFARSQGVSVGDLAIRTDEKGEYVWAVRHEEGGPVGAALAAAFPGIIGDMSFPKSMRWGDREFRFVRPIRWILALWGDDPVEFDVDGIASGRTTFGHRFFGGDGPVAVGAAEDYIALLREGFCIVDQEERMRSIRNQVDALAAQKGGRALVDDELLSEVTYLVEYPTAFLGGFDPRYLSLPRDVLITTMKEHQRYFPVFGQDGQLMAAFIGVRDGTGQNLDIVRRGNERVLCARLSDAEFFFDEDRKVPLERQVEKLKGIMFHERLGTMFDKTQRLVRLAGWLCGALGAGDDVSRVAERAAFLAKADLPTNMVKEFTELQGTMGREYAILSGESDDVARAIFEHYLPRYAGDLLPESPAGSIVALADKMDTLAGFFRIGIQPTGSEDPYALRRMGSGLVEILAGAGLVLSLRGFASRAFEQFDAHFGASVDPAAARDLMAFLEQRVRGLLASRNIRYDIIDAVVAAGFDDVLSCVKRAQAFTSVVGTQAFELVVTGFTRARNIAGERGPGPVDTGLLIEPAERALFGEYQRIRQEVDNALLREDYEGALNAFATLAGPIDRFFKEVLVMARDEAVRENRLALLALIADIMRGIGDLSKIVIPSEGNQKFLSNKI
ncbi:MAG: glycine--tRNA ligase subunit beta [Firmicutes bacterium]|nr:glycine--tRNA ligase subunit beta [Bacillota bacterium]